MRNVISAFVAFALALAIALSSVGHAAARNQAHGAQTLVICTGYGLVRITMDADGNPVEQTLPCPDCLVTPAALLAEVEVHARLYEHRSERSDLSSPLRFSAAAGCWHEPRGPPQLV
ncbi:hypothetical protein [Roseinatronobacter bogoriensis]|uniref:DUF2946 domain-containing protein n=1 Tax=Roseinatronobacter bogoriensis subsp. barguzinensis TaxID=441209 RepID=A0A2K8K601_9RHOB|nr:hypothetical protein [Rhodobaca]ATX64871.1 hypothetical protein BG454_02655 [Rhodobaca barguzinensis]MBB4208672.1 hypothetical protein [Rhodobaca bogoriensis DSM 18756]TDW38060.1 hypothetical protein LY39_02415 [Rhodobaca barguzinensis]TDY69770.1 hypothetical protein EV660_103164 [Rhodobaca bogoriensis DSM 18756]